MHYCNVYMIVQLCAVVVLMGCPYIMMKPRFICYLFHQF